MGRVLLYEPVPPGNCPKPIPDHSLGHDHDFHDHWFGRRLRIIQQVASPCCDFDMLDRPIREH